jgi:hypothetical protein
MPKRRKDGRKWIRKLRPDGTFVGLELSDPTGGNTFSPEDEDKPLPDDDGPWRSPAPLAPPSGPQPGEPAAPLTPDIEPAPHPTDPYARLREVVPCPLCGRMVQRRTMARAGATYTICGPCDRERNIEPYNRQMVLRGVTPGS